MVSGVIVRVPSLAVTVIYAAAALFPAFVLMRYIYRCDTVEKEPTPLLIALLGSGVLSALIASIAEGIGMRLLEWLSIRDQRLALLALTFGVIAVAEEGAKLLLLKRRSWSHPAFNYRFDGIVYAVFVSLGFAAFENVGYVFAYGLSAAALRALTAVPGHLSFAVFMGVFYSRAKACENWGDSRRAKKNLWAAFLVPVFFHGFYDTCAMMDQVGSTVIFLVFVAGLFGWVFRLVRRESNQDHPI